MGKENNREILIQKDTVGFPGLRWRGAKMRDFKGVAGQPEILAFAGR
jgi:hypothetical protein